MMVLILAVICCVVVLVEVFTYRPSAVKHGVITKNKTYRHVIVALSQKPNVAYRYSARAYRRHYQKQKPSKPSEEQLNTEGSFDDG